MRLNKSIVSGFAILIISVTIYIPAIHSDFIWDDDDYVQNNQTLRSLKGLGQIWTEPKSIPQYYPLVHTTFWIEYQFWALNPIGFHIVNIFLHGLSAVLLWRILRSLSVPGAWLAAVVFAIHPVNVETVAWIAERKNVLSGLLYLASLSFYIKFDIASTTTVDKKNWSVYVISLLLFIGALLSKTVTCTLPAAILLLLWWKRDKIKGIDIIHLIPFFLIGISLALLTVWLEKVHVGAEGAEWSMPFFDRTLAAGRISCFYAGKLLFPINLIFVYPRWTIDTGIWWQYLFPLFLVVCLIFLFLTRRQIGKGWLVGMAGFVITLFPCLSFINVYPMRYSFVADHYQYLATPWFIALIIGGMAWFVKKQVRNIMAIVATRCLSTLVLLVLAMLTWQRCHVFLNLENLWLDTLAKNPGCWMAHNNMGKYLQGEGKLDEAIEHYHQSINIRTESSTANYNLGNALFAKGEIDQAIEYLTKATRLDSDFATAYFSLGNVYKKKNKINEAMRNYQKAIEINPDFYSPHYNLANTYKQIGQTEKAIYHYLETVRIKPDHGKAHFQLGLAMKSVEQIEEAIQHLETAEQLLPESPLVKNELAWLLAACPDTTYRNGEKALRLALSAAEQTEHRHPVILDTLAAAYAEQGKFEKAVSVIKDALKLTDNDLTREIVKHLHKQLNRYKNEKAGTDESLEN